MGTQFNCRVLSYEDQRRMRQINSVVKEANAQLIDRHVSIRCCDPHLLDRSRDWGLDVDDVMLVLAYVIRQRSNELIETCEGYNIPFLKFAIKYSDSFIIHCSFKTYDDGRKVIRFSTVIPNRTNYAFDSFCMQINKLVRKPVAIE